jgi:hypothetical protein
MRFKNLDYILFSGKYEMQLSAVEWDGKFDLNLCHSTCTCNLRSRSETIQKKFISDVYLYVMVNVDTK